MQWSKYAIANIIIKCLQYNQPSSLVGYLNETLYVERQAPHHGKFYNNSKGKVAIQKLGNNLEFMNAIKENWYGVPLGPDNVRKMLKRTFFSYLTLLPANRTPQLLTHRVDTL